MLRGPKFQFSSLFLHSEKKIQKQTRAQKEGSILKMLIFSTRPEGQAQILIYIQSVHHSRPRITQKSSEILVKIVVSPAVESSKYICHHWKALQMHNTTLKEKKELR